MAAIHGRCTTCKRMRAVHVYPRLGRLCDECYKRATRPNTIKSEVRKGYVDLDLDRGMVHGDVPPTTTT